MERKIMNELSKWRVNLSKKPILLYGIPGCGKTYITLEFGKNEYKNVIYFDCDGNLELNYVFDKNNTLDKLIRGLSAISLETVFQEESLIILDNATEKIINSVKDIFSNTSSYHIILITDKQDIYNKYKSSDFNLKKMFLVSFPEYLKFLGKEQLIDFIDDSFKNSKQMPFHSIALELFNDFVLTGGYPDAVTNYNENQNYNLLFAIHEKNIKVMKNRLFEMDNLIDIKRSNEIFDSMTLQLLKENKKFQYGLLKQGARAKEYERAILFMDNNDLIIKSNRIKELTSPISNLKDEDNFKLYYHDSGFLYRKMNVTSNRLLTNDKLFEVLYENNIVQTLNQNGLYIYHYHSGGKAEIDIVIQTRNGKIIPMEIMNRNFSTKSKSMVLAMQKYNLSYGIRFGTDNFKERKGIKYIPFYASFCITETL